MTTNHKTAWSISILGLVDCWLVKRLILQVMHGFISFTSKRSQCRRYFNKFNRQGQLDNPLTGQTGRAWNLCDHWLFQDGGCCRPLRWTSIPNSWQSALTAIQNVTWRQLATSVSLLLFFLSHWFHWFLIPTLPYFTPGSAGLIVAPLLFGTTDSLRQNHRTDRQ